MPIQTAFNSGEYSNLMDGSVDFDPRQRSCKLLQNMICLKQGPATRRGPTVFVKEVKSSSNRTGFLRFLFNSGDAFVIEAGDQYFRFYKNYVQVESSGSPYEVSTPYTQANLFDSNNLFKIQTAQSGDVLYIVHGSYKPMVLVRVTDVSWTLSTLTLEDGPYLDVNSTSTTLTLGGTTGSVSVTASATTGINGGSGFATTDVGRLIRWKDPANNWTWLEITGWTSTTVVTATIRGANASATTATVNWRLGVWSDTTGWPTSISFYQERLWMGGASSYPDRVDGSKVAGYSSTTITFQPTNAAGTVADDNAITVVLPSGQINGLKWLATDSRGLIAGTAKDEFLIRSTTFGESITPTNKTAVLFSSTGSAAIPAVRTMFGVTFVQSARRRFFDVIYSIEQDNLAPMDISIAATHLSLGGIISTSYQQEPYNVVWAITNTGSLIGCTHYPDQKVWGWHRHVIGGYIDSGLTENAVVEAITCIPGNGGVRDDLWLIVRRLINGQTKRYVEWMRPSFEGNEDLEDEGCADSRFTYSGVATNVVTGLSHLEGQVVKVMVDGNSHPDLTVSSGQVTLANDRQGEKIQIGLAYTWKLLTNKAEVKFKDGDTAQGRKKRISDIALRVLNAKGMRYSQPDGELFEYDFNQGLVYNETQTLYSGDISDLAWPGGTDDDGMMYFEHDGVFPFTMSAIVTNIQVNK